MTLGWIQTASGRRFDVLTPRAEDVDFGDIAHGLGRQCRYNGHCQTFYSVAEHSCLVAMMLRALGEPLEVLRWGLLHDAAEAYVGDMPRPLKHLPALAVFSEIEDRVMQAIVERFDLGPKPQIIRDLDRQLVDIEAPLVLGRLHPDWPADENGQPTRAVEPRFREAWERVMEERALTVRGGQWSPCAVPNDATNAFFFMGLALGVEREIAR